MILLASDGTRREGIHSEMQQVSTPFTVGALTGRTTTFGTIPMAIHEMGDGYSWVAATGPGKVRFFLILTDYFTKWVETGPYQKISEREVVDFLLENIICWFRIPKEIAFGNGPQFIGSKVTKFLEDLKIKRITSSPYYPSANEQAESTYKVIIQNLKIWLEVAKGKWPKELPGVLWAYRMTAKSSRGETPFSLVYNAEALILVEIGEPNLRYFRADEEAKIVGQIGAA
ncbi:PREDICTED: protein NYNRIN-like [Nicotiana attenuata]|uniref:protein NYNRIN-like n=1 Tax=Nicotiana attenuata TaxID=49451 RepID=UPI00090570B5|nr:PREDICTED: protein NYNRIN-like [Nicotiana attenuata]